MTITLIMLTLITPTIVLSVKQWSCPIPYEINRNLNDPERVQQAIDHITGMTGWSFIKYDSSIHDDYLHFQNSEFCSSHVGKIGGKQLIRLSDGCDTGAAIHEIAHAIGMPHTQSRVDRDVYVNIDTENIIDDNAHNFDISEIPILGNYDYNSIMHYGLWDFANNQNSKVLTPIHDTTNICHIGSQTELSSTDIVQLNSLIDGPHCGKSYTLLSECNSENIVVCGGIKDKINGIFFREYTLESKNVYRSVYPIGDDYMYIKKLGSQWTLKYTDYSTNDLIGGKWENFFGNTLDISVSHKTCCKKPLLVGDGVCHPENNNNECHYDGGDCCEESCQNGECNEKFIESCKSPYYLPPTNYTYIPTEDDMNDTEILFYMVIIICLILFFFCGCCWVWC